MKVNKKHIQKGLEILTQCFPIDFEIFKEVRETYIKLYGQDPFILRFGNVYMESLEVYHNPRKDL